MPEHTCVFCGFEYKRPDALMSVGPIVPEHTIAGMAQAVILCPFSMSPLNEVKRLEVRMDEKNQLENPEDE